MTATVRESAEYCATVTQRVPIGRFLESREIAVVILSLCRDSMSALVGTTILANGGSVLS